MGEAIKAYGQGYGQSNQMEQLVLSAFLQQMAQQQRSAESEKRSQQITPYQQAMIDLSNKRLTSQSENQSTLADIQKMLAESKVRTEKATLPATVESLKAGTAVKKQTVKSMQEQNINRRGMLKEMSRKNRERETILRRDLALKEKSQEDTTEIKRVLAQNKIESTWINSALKSKALDITDKNNSELKRRWDKMFPGRERLMKAKSEGIIANVVTSARDQSARQKATEAKTALEKKMADIKDKKTTADIIIQRRNMDRLEKQDKANTDYRKGMLQELVDARKDKDKFLRERLRVGDIRDYDKIKIQRDLANNKIAMDRYDKIIKGKKFATWDYIQKERVSLLGKEHKLKKNVFEEGNDRWDKSFKLQRESTKSLIDQRKAMIENARKQLSLVQTNSDREYKLKNFISHHSALMRGEEVALKKGIYKDNKQFKRESMNLRKIESKRNYELSKSEVDAKIQDMMYVREYRRKSLRLAEKRLRSMDKNSSEARSLQKWIENKRDETRNIELNIKERNIDWEHDYKKELFGFQKEMQKYKVSKDKIDREVNNNRFKDNLQLEYKRIEANKEKTKELQQQRAFIQQQRKAEKTASVARRSGEIRYANLEKSINANVQQIQRFLGGKVKDPENFKVALTSLVEGLKEKRKLAKMINQANPSLNYKARPEQTTVDLLNRSSNYFSGQSQEKLQKDLKRAQPISARSAQILPSTALLNYAQKMVGVNPYWYERASQQGVANTPINQPDPINMMISEYLNQLNNQQQSQAPVPPFDPSAPIQQMEQSPAGMLVQQQQGLNPYIMPGGR